MDEWINEWIDKWIPLGYSPLGLSGQLRERCPVSPQMKHLANGNGLSST